MKQLLVTIRKKLSRKQGLLKALENISWLSFDKFFRLGIGLVITILMVRYLGPEQFGKLNFAITFVSLFGVIASLGLQGLIVRDILYEPSATNEILGTSAVIHSFGGFISYLFLIVSISYLQPDNYEGQSLVAAIGLINLLKPFDVILYWLESQVKSKYAVMAQTIATIISNTVKLALIINAEKLVLFGWAIVIESILSLFFILWLCQRCNLDISSLNFIFSIKRAKEILKNCWPMLLTSIAITVYLKIDQIMIGVMIDDQAVGIYTAATKISEIWYFLPTIITASLYPIILKIKKQGDDYNEQFQYLFDVMALLSFSVIILTILFSKFFINEIYGVAYSAAATVLSAHIFSGLFVCFGVVSSSWLLMENLQTINLKRTLLGAAVNITLNFILIPKHGIIGAAIATIIAYMSATIISDIFYLETRILFTMQMNSLNLIKATHRVRARLSL